MKVTLGKNQKPRNVPFYVELSFDDFGRDYQAYGAYLDELHAQWRAQAAQAEENQPLRTEFAPDTNGERQYNAALQSWSVERGVSKAMEANKPKPTSETMPRELAALHYGDGQDKKRAAEVMQWRSIVDEQLANAAKYETFDGPNSRRVIDAKQRAAQYQRAIDKVQKERYAFEEKAYSESTKWGGGELEKWMKAKPEDVEKNMDSIRGLIEGYRAMADTDYSFALDGNQIVKLHHPGTPANQVEAAIGTTEDHHLLRILGVHGIERHEEPKPEKKEEAAPAK